MRIDANPLQISEAHYGESSAIYIVVVTECAKEVVMVEVDDVIHGITEGSTQMLTT